MSVLEALRIAAPAALSGTGVFLAYLFGSQATGRARDTSDVDVAVMFRDEPTDSVDESIRIAGALERATELRPVEILVLNGARLPLRGRVVREGIAIFSIDEPARVRFETATLKEFLDYEVHAPELRRAYLRNVAEGRA